MPALDGLRGVAILAVLIHHSFIATPVGWTGVRAAAVFEFLGHGVDLFFALSGFLIIRVLRQASGTPGFAVSFWLRRFAKIVPLYATTVAGVFLILPSLLRLAHASSKLAWLEPHRSEWVWYASFTSNVHNAIDRRFTNPALDVSWSLAVEVQFYLLAFLLARFVSVRLWPAIAYASILCAVGFRAGTEWATHSWIAVLVLTPGRMDAFAFGALATLAPGRIRAIPGWWIGAFLSVPLLLGWSREYLVVETIGYSVVSLIAGWLVVRAADTQVRDRGTAVLTHQSLAWLGRISYSIYLTHIPVRAVLRDVFVGGDLPLTTARNGMVQGVFTVAAVAVCTLCGWLTWRFIEEPARKWIVTRCVPPAIGAPAIAA